MDKSYEAGMSPRKRIASGDKDPFAVGNYDVESLASRAAGGPTSTSKTLADHERGAPPPIGGNQANPDHGGY